MTLSKAKLRTRDFRRYRLSLGLTQDECAEALGWGEGTIAPGSLVSRKENGVVVVRGSDLLALECLLRRARNWPVKWGGRG